MKESGESLDGNCFDSLWVGGRSIVGAFNKMPPVAVQLPVYQLAGSLFAAAAAADFILFVTFISVFVELYPKIKFQGQ